MHHALRPLLLVQGVAPPPPPANLPSKFEAVVVRGGYVLHSAQLYAHWATKYWNHCQTLLVQANSAVGAHVDLHGGSPGAAHRLIYNELVLQPQAPQDEQGDRGLI